MARRAGRGRVPREPAGRASPSVDRCPYELIAGLVNRGQEDLLGSLQQDLRWVEFHPFELRNAASTARIESTLVAEGRRIPVPDLMIAALARNRDATLVAADDHFKRVRDLDSVNFRTA